MELNANCARNRGVLQKKKRLTLVLQPLSVHPGLCPVTHSSFVLKRPVFNHRNIKPVKRWFKTFMETGSILDRKKSGRPSIDEEATDAVRVTFHRSPRKSIRVASNELAIPGSTVHKVLHKRLRLMLTSYSSS